MVNTVKGGEKQIPLIKCPYCFHQFSHEKVCFKAKTVFTGQDIEALEDDTIWDLGRVFGLGKDGRTVNREAIKKFIEKEDEEYKKFWNEYPGSEPEWEYAHYPVITPQSFDMMDAETGYQTDASGFVFSVIDCFGRASSIRICPKCHNELPDSYGKYPACMIAIVGITSSGKTVYLSQLMQNFSKIMALAGMGALKTGNSVDRFIRENRVARDEFLPQGTLPEHLSQPLFYKIKNEIRTYMLVFYDIAGENCVDSVKMRKYGHFIQNADGIIFMIDPEQFFQLRKDLNRDVPEPEAVLSALSSAFLDIDNRNGRSDKPLAVVITKSDTLRKKTKEISADSNIFQKIRYDKKGFQLASYRDINGELRSLFAHLSQGEEVLANLKACFTKFGLFAVSALDSGVEMVKVPDSQGKEIIRYKPMNTPSTIRIEEPLFWILSQKMMISQIDDEAETQKKGFWYRFMKSIQ